MEDGTTPSQTGRLRITCYNAGTSESLTATGQNYFSDRNWHQVAFTLEGGTGRIYVDGLQVGSKNMIAPGNTDHGLYLGSHQGSSSHWIGAMDELSFYRRGLQAEEIRSDYLAWAPESHRQPQENQGLTGQWDFDGTFDNAVESQNPAVPSAALSFVEGIQNQGLELDGTATVNLGTTADVTLENGTISLWVKLESPLGTSNGRFVLLANQESDSGFRLIIDDDTDPVQAGSIQWTTYKATTTKVLSSGSYHWPLDEDWHHLAVTKENTNAKMYLDGVLIGTTDTLDTPDATGNPLYIGAIGTGTGYPWMGAIDQLKVYTEALPPYEILGAYLESEPEITSITSPVVVTDPRFLLFASDTDAYGNPLREYNNPAESVTPEPHGFTGQEREPEFGLVYYGARWYMADLGRFLQVDPRREFWNSYSYVGNNPIILVDPTGMYGDHPYLEAIGRTFAAFGKSIADSLVATGELIIFAATLETKSEAELQEINEQAAQNRAAIAEYPGLVLDFYTEGGVLKRIDHTIVGMSDDQRAQYITFVTSTSYAVLSPFAGGGTIVQPPKVPTVSQKVINQANHIFGTKNLDKHKLGSTLDAFDGDQIAAFRAIEKGAQGLADSRAISGIFQTVVKVRGHSITLRGRVIDGVVNVSTALIP